MRAAQGKDTQRWKGGPTKLSVSSWHAPSVVRWGTPPPVGTLCSGRGAPVHELKPRGTTSTERATRTQLDAGRGAASFRGVTRLEGTERGHEHPSRTVRRRLGVNRPVGALARH